MYCIKKSFNPRKSVKNIYFNPTVYNGGLDPTSTKLLLLQEEGRRTRRGRKRRVRTRW
jgi:hypothetical protein